MKPVQEMSLGELAAWVCSHLRENGIDTVLSGGGCVSIYSSNQYQSVDLDFIENISTSRQKIKRILAEIGFHEEHRYFEHPETRFILEFPPGPLAVGQEPVKETARIVFETGELTLLSPTDSVKDRLSAYYHWNDNQALNQALLVAEAQKVDIKEIERWSIAEGKAAEFAAIRGRFEEGKKWYAAESRQG